MYTKWTMAQLQWTNTLSFTEQWALGLFSAWWTKAGSFLWCLCHHLNFCLHLLPARGRRKRVWKPILLVLHCSVVGCSPGWHHWLNGHESEQTLEDGEGRGAWRAAVHGVTKSQTWLSNWTTFTFQWLSHISHNNMLCCTGLEDHSPWWGSCFSATSVHVL